MRKIASVTAYWKLSVAGVSGTPVTDKLLKTDNLRVVKDHFR